MVSRFTKHKIVDILNAIAEGELKVGTAISTALSITI